MIREMWRAASAPRAFFERLELQAPRILRGAGVAALGFAALALACALGFIRATRSDAYAPVMAFALLGGAGLYLYAYGFASLFVQRPGALDVRAWEVAGWSWGGAFFAALSMLPALLLVPGPALAATLLLALGWHLSVLRVGLAVFLNRPAWRAVVLYALFTYAFPAAVLAFLAWFSTGFLAGGAPSP